jgi:GDP-L-fucose synthase
VDKQARIYVAGHQGLVGSAILRKLNAEGYRNIITRTLHECDLTRQTEVEAFFESEQPQYVFMAAARVGGIWANDRYPAEFIYQNVMIQSNVIHAAYRAAVAKLLFLGSSCIYPRECPQPMKEEYLLTGELEATNEPYAIAKIAGVKMCQAYNRQYGTRFVSLMPTNLYGPGDNFDLQHSHVLPALMRKSHEAKIADTSRGARDKRKNAVTVWGTGAPRREFLYVDDLAEACLFVMNHYEENDILNVGVGKDISVKELAELTSAVVGFEGDLIFDETKPDGTPRKLLDVTRLKTLGWQSRTTLRQGLERTYRWFVENVSDQEEVTRDE